MAALEAVTIEIDESQGAGGDGEIIVHGPNVMKGYHARPDDNARAFTADGGLRTGDLGRVDEAGYVYITGRLKEQYKLENGKYVMPSPLEERLSLSPYIASVMLHGANRPYNVALVVIDEAQVRRWAIEHDLQLGREVDRDDRVREMVQDELDRLSKDFRPFERPRDCVLTASPFTVDNGLLTPTLKLRRRAIEARFAGALAGLYGDRLARAPIAPRSAAAAPGAAAPRAP
jgi:long-chain acyl-CoA synthetase